jgi:hypothetical protein
MSASESKPDGSFLARIREIGLLQHGVAVLRSSRQTGNGEEVVHAAVGREPSFTHRPVGADDPEVNQWIHLRRGRELVELNRGPSLGSCLRHFRSPTPFRRRLPRRPESDRANGGIAEHERVGVREEMANLIESRITRQTTKGKL